MVGSTPVTAGASIVYNVEDNATEQRRRLSAAARQFGAKPADIAGKVIRSGPSGVGTLLTRDDAGRVHFTPAMSRLEQLIIQHNADVLFVDPLSELHTSEENDNGAMRAIVARFREVGRQIQYSRVHPAPHTKGRRRISGRS